MEAEIWKSIKGYEGHYFVSNLGSVKTNNHYGSGKDAILKPAKDNKGYLRVSLTKDKILKTYKVHRLVALAFIENPNNKPQVNHKNGIKTDNRIDNLEWCTNTENVHHAINLGLFVFSTPEKSVNKQVKSGELNGCHLLTEKQVLEIRSKFKPREYTRKMLALEYGVKESTIKDVVLNKSWRHI